MHNAKFFRRVCIALSVYLEMTYDCFWRYAVMHFMHGYAGGLSDVRQVILVVLMARLTLADRAKARLSRIGANYTHVQ